MSDTLGIYVSVPFCRAKCSFCNFASGVFAAERMDGYMARLCEEIGGSRGWGELLTGMPVGKRVDSIYFGGGTPSLLQPAAIAAVFACLRGHFTVEDAAEITVECAPGQVADQALAAFQAEGVNRLTFGVQSFVDAEATAVGRTHTGASCREELRRMTAAGVTRLGIDLIVGLPLQTEASWRYSVEQAIASGVEHVSVYMLEIDDDSRLGREAQRGGGRYGVGALPEEDRVADWYAAACEWLAVGGLQQYEISNFARDGGQSRHNRKYWERQPYLGFGLDAHSMLRTTRGEAVRWANPEEMDGYVGPGIGARGFERTVDRVDRDAAFEERLFLGLRMNEGVNLARAEQEFGRSGVLAQAVAEVEEAGLVRHEGEWLRLTAPGRLASNEVFGRLLLGQAV